MDLPFEIINTKQTCKDKAMDWIEAEMKAQGKDLRGMEFDHTDENGHQHFRVMAVTPTPTQKMIHVRPA